MTYKIIISGRLEFGNAKSYEKVLKLYQQRLETFYRLDTLLKTEEIFSEGTSSIDIPRFIAPLATDKSWQNTIKLLDYVAQFAVAGSLSAWMTDNGKVMQYKVIEPNSDKTAVQAYQEGRKLIKEAGKEKEARAALSSAIEKFERHALAYERRGWVNYLLRNLEDALYDYNKSIDINPNNGETYVGRAIVKMTQNDWKGAVVDLDSAIKNSIPLEPTYWKARRIKAECHLQQQDFKAAITELKLFNNRAFNKEDSNYKWRQKAWSNYGMALFSIGEFSEAAKAFEMALKIADASIAVPQGELIQLRDQALQAGKAATAVA